MTILKPRCGNLIQNGSFESGLSYWQAENAGVANSSPPEGTQALGMWAGIGSLYQIVPISPFQQSPLLLSFITYRQEASGAGSLTAEVLWLDSDFNAVGTGLRAVIPSAVINNSRITFFDVTDSPPLSAVWAKLLFSKGQGDTPIFLDLVNLAPVGAGNLLQNPSFEYGLEGWTAAGFNPSFSTAYTGSASAAADQISGNGSLVQTVPLRPAWPGSVYLLSVACWAMSYPLQVVVRWLNILGNPIGDPAVNVQVSAATLGQQENYLNIVQVTTPSPLGAVAASVELGYSGVVPAFAFLDQALLLRLASPNLLTNPGFASGLDGWTSQGAAISSDGAYVGVNYAVLSGQGAFIHQTVELPPFSPTGCFLFNFALRFAGNEGSNGQVLAQVHWLNRLGREVGLGASLNIAETLQLAPQWQVYTAFSERPPLAAAYARIQFTKAQSGALANIGLDSVTFAKIL